MDNRARGGTCGRCNATRKKGTRTRVCTTCAKRYCPACSRTQPRCHQARTDMLALLDQLAATPGGATEPLANSADTAPPDVEEIPLPPLDALLTAATAMPAMPTITWCPRSLRARLGDVLIQLLHNANTALEQASGTQACTEALQLLWAAPTILMRRPPKRPHDSADADASALSTMHILRRRLAYAEAGKWQALLLDYLEERGGRPANPTVDAADVTAGDVSDRLGALAAAVRKVEGGCLRAAAQLLRGDARVPGTADTRDQLEALTALPVDEAERVAIREQVDTALACSDQVPLIKVRTLRRKLRTIKRGAEPGPSGWRNAHITLIGERPHGVEELTRWARAYATGSLCPWDARLWSSVILVPLDKGGGKIRPIALGEALSKLAQAVLLDTIQAHLRSSFEPHQLSVRTPGGAELLVRTLRAWTAAPEGRSLLQLDLKNAYGADVQEQDASRRHTALPSPGTPASATVGARGIMGMDEGESRMDFVRE